ncbi:SubName: Full=Uncharacterized protein {ECO:0000313/EMBL:CCA74106.1} [Serendipita indica DSM 11827]|nr:SubName: Full=Uncharacterized protein {ECO:0000313/EMBL:CCA74106.1} [Serendipita indica DSM 11827]
MSFEGNLAYIPTEEEIETAWWLFFGCQYPTQPMDNNGSFSGTPTQSTPLANIPRQGQASNTVKMIEPVDEKLARSDHHSRQGMRKSGDRAKKFSQKNAAKPKSPSQSAATTTSTNRTHGKRVKIVTAGHARRAVDSGPSEDEDENYFLQGGSGGIAGRTREDAIAYDERRYGSSHKGVDGIVLDETREAATVIPIEELLATAYAKKPRKSRASQFDHIRGLGKQYVSVAPKSRTGMSTKSRRQFPHEEEADSDWESIGEDPTEAWDYNSEWRAEMGDILGETTNQKMSYRDITAAVVSIDSSLGSESAATEKTDDLP